MTDLRGARVLESRAVAQGTRWLVFEADEPLPEAYGPGNVLAFYVCDLDGKWIRHPYTVSWADGQRVGLLYRVIPTGRATPVMAELKPGEIVRFGGRYGEPIAGIVPADASGVVGVSTGTGIGPLHGFAAASLAAGFARPITLYTGFRTARDIALGVELEALAASHPNFTWHPVLSAPDAAWAGLTGRVTDVVPGRLAGDVHVHLVGNGAMVAELRAGLLAGGLEARRVTQEVYFNRTAAPDPTTVARIAAAVAR